MWEFFDDIVCINLETRWDRYEHAKQVFASYSIPGRIMKVQKHHVSGMQGCFESHLSIIRNAYQQQQQHVLVFEDDLAPTKSYNEQYVRDAIRFMSENNDWDIFYFGYFVFNDKMHPLQTFLTANSVEPHIIQYNPFATHAYCINRRGMDKVLQRCTEYMTTVHYDIFLASHAGLKNYCYVPMLFDQKFCFASDIAPNNAIERIARSCQCFADKSNILYHISYFKYILDMYIHLVLAITIIVFIILIMVRNFS